MMRLITAASNAELAREIAEQVMRLGNDGGVFETLMYQEIWETHCDRRYVHYEAHLFYHWRAIDEGRRKATSATDEPAREIFLP